MCRSLVSVDWQGYVYDCDFNQMLGLPLRVAGRRARARSRTLIGARSRRATRSWCATTATAAPRARARAAAGRSREPGGMRARRSCLRRSAARAAPARWPTAMRPRVFDRAARDRGATRSTWSAASTATSSALDAVLAMRASEAGAALVFNGDFHWFDVTPTDFAARRRGACSRTRALRGNVETELAARGSRRGLRLRAIPAEVSDAEVAALERDPRARCARRRARLPGVRARARARCRCISWRASATRAWASCTAMPRRSPAGASRTTGSPSPRTRAGSRARSRDATVDVFASSHTCLPVLHALVDGAARAVVNNGAAGMPNFAGSRYGIVTRIAPRPAGAERLYGSGRRGAHVDALRLDYDHERWLARFLAAWPAGSPAHASYHRRIVAKARATA